MGEQVSGALPRLLRCWGKTDPDNPAIFHPALFHMLDVGSVAIEVLSDQASPRWRNVLAKVFNTESSILAQWLPCLVALHDIGKISSAFQFTSAAPTQAARMKSEDFQSGMNINLSHPQVGQVFISREWANSDGLSKTHVLVLRDMIGGHHGRFSPPGGLADAEAQLIVFEPPEWKELRIQVAELIFSLMAPAQRVPGTFGGDISAATMMLTGFTILCDWIGSNRQFFPPEPDCSLEEYLTKSRQRARLAADGTGMFLPCASNKPPNFTALFKHLSPPRPLQNAIDAIPYDILQKPCLAIIESPTGEGKTEAALALAHRLAVTNGTDELYYALPTTATSNQMFKRVQKYLGECLGLPTQVKLIHGQAFLFEDELQSSPLLNGENGDTHPSLEWFNTSKRSLLAPFGVGTVDQVELGALNTSFTALRLLGMAGKVVIFDEVHAYDMYMTTIIERLLNWLSSLGVSVVLLSATLPQSRRKLLAEAYIGNSAEATLEQSSSYPNLWIWSESGEHQVSPPAANTDLRISLSTLNYGSRDADGKARWLYESVKNGGCACWITNTVQRAQDMYAALRGIVATDVNCLLLHSRFPLNRRQELEKEIDQLYGFVKSTRPVKGIVIGTQVIEQSLDLDFDVMVSDLAPVDLLLQRAGRLHRHAHTPTRPAAWGQPHLFVNMDLEEDGNLHVEEDKYVYPEYLLRRTWQVLQSKSEIVLPSDYRLLVEEVYNDNPPPPNDSLSQYWEKFIQHQNNVVNQAKLRLIPKPNPLDTFSGAIALSHFVEKEGDASWIVAQTRLGEQTIQVIPLERRGVETWLFSGNRQIHLNEVETRDVQLEMLRHCVRINDRRLVNILLSHPIPLLFRRAPLLAGSVPLIFENGECTFNTHISVKMDMELGLKIEQL